MTLNNIEIRKAGFLVTVFAILGYFLFCNTCLFVCLSVCLSVYLFTFKIARLLLLFQQWIAPKVPKIDQENLHT